jgi:hypothetical protein
VAGDGDVEGDGERPVAWGFGGELGMSMAGMFGIEERIVRFDGS